MALAHGEVTEGKPAAIPSGEAQAPGMILAGVVETLRWGADEGGDPVLGAEKLVT